MAWLVTAAEGSGDGRERTLDRQPEDVARSPESRARERGERWYGFSFDELTQNFEISKSKMSVFLFQRTRGYGIYVL